MLNSLSRTQSFRQPQAQLVRDIFAAANLVPFPKPIAAPLSTKKARFPSLWTSPFFLFLSRSFSFPFPPGVLPRLNFSCYIGQQAPPTTFFATTTLSTTLVINTLGQVNVVSFSLPFPIHSPFSIPHSPFPTCSCPLQRFQVLTLLLLGSPPPTAPSDRRPFRFPIDSETIHPKAYGRLSPLSARALPRLPSAPPLDLHRRPADPYHNSTSFWHHAFYSARHRSDPETATRFTYFT